VSLHNFPLYFSALDL